MLVWLAFAPEHEFVARDIAVHAARRAAQVGSGRVGRTKTLTLEERAALAARADIRHRYTDYDEHLERLEMAEFGLDDPERRRRLLRTGQLDRDLMRQKGAAAMGEEER